MDGIIKIWDKLIESGEFNLKRCDGIYYNRGNKYCSECTLDNICYSTPHLSLPELQAYLDDRPHLTHLRIVL